MKNNETNKPELLHSVLAYKSQVLKHPTFVVVITRKAHTGYEFETSHINSLN